jgi:hypothetical protein
MGFLIKMKQWLLRQPGSPVTEGAEKTNLEDLLKKIAVYKRNTWMPVIEDEAQDLLASKIGGKAYIPEGESFPSCPNCKEEMTLFLQLNPKDLPEQNDLALEKGKLIQLFYCTNQDPHCEVECEAYFPFSKSVLARTLPLPSSPPADLFAQPAAKRQFKEKLITDWVPYDDYPDWHEMQLGDARLSENEVEMLENSESGIPKAADKLGGWPYWVQGVEYPSCPACGIQMQMIFQLDSNHHLPYMFGDAGIAHLHQCRLHKDILALGWAGY